MYFYKTRETQNNLELRNNVSPQGFFSYSYRLVSNLALPEEALWRNPVFQSFLFFASRVLKIQNSASISPNLAAFGSDSAPVGHAKMYHNAGLFTVSSRDGFEECKIFEPG